jgi:bifunctional non-homologous end joining protein LigD
VPESCSDEDDGDARAVSRARAPRASRRRAARPAIALAPMLHRAGVDDDLAAVDDAFVLSALPDGWRCLAILDDRVRVRARGGQDLAPRVPAVASALARLRARIGDGTTILDGVLVLADTGEERWPALDDVAALVVLDAPCLAGRDLRSRPLRERRELLRALAWPDDPALRLAQTWRGDARASLAQLTGSGASAAAALLARRDGSPYRPGVRSDDWIAFGERALTEMLLCGIASSGALLLGRCTPLGLVPAGATWPTRRWRALAARCREGAPPFVSSDLWPSLGAVAWARPELWLAVEPDVRAGSGRGGPRWRAVRVQEDLSPPADIGWLDGAPGGPAASDR